MEDWTEKYRPKTLDEVVGNERAILDLRRWANSWKKGIPKKRAVILSGKAGNGKTSSALALAKDYGWTPIELNTSDARNAAKIKKVATSGALHETFSHDGRFITSKSGGRKLIILDEADNLYERIQGTSADNDDLSDKGGKKAIIDTIKITSQPIILIVNDYYNLIKGSGEVFKNICQLIRFYDPYPNNIVSLLKRISLSEGISVDRKVLQNIANRCKGDVRSAINDLQCIALDKKQIDSSSLNVLGYRDREKDIFTVLREIFKTRNIQAIKDSSMHLDIDPKLMLLWINENLPKEYLDFEDMVRGYESVSKADVFLGRSFRRQHFGLWSYACDFMNGGVATSKTHNYPNKNYNFPTWLRQKKADKTTTDSKYSIIQKISDISHSSNNKTKNYFLPFFKDAFRNDTGFAIKMRNKFDFTEQEIKFLLGKSHSNKLKEILLSKDKKQIKSVDQKEGVEKKIQEDKKEDIQQTLFDF
jgi:replication factor C large subunit